MSVSKSYIPLSNVVPVLGEKRREGGRRRGARLRAIRVYDISVGKARDAPNVETQRNVVIGKRKAENALENRIPELLL